VFIFQFLATEQHLPVFTVEGLEPYALFNLSVTPYTYWGKGPKTSLSLRAPETGTGVNISLLKKKKKKKKISTSKF
jgi:hypothetical protein